MKMITLTIWRSTMMSFCYCFFFLSSRWVCKTHSDLLSSGCVLVSREFWVKFSSFMRWISIAFFREWVFNRFFGRAFCSCLLLLIDSWFFFSLSRINGRGLLFEYFSCFNRQLVISLFLLLHCIFARAQIKWNARWSMFSSLSCTLSGGIK